MKHFLYINVTKLTNAKSKMQISHKTKSPALIMEICHLDYAQFVVTEFISGLVVG